MPVLSRSSPATTPVSSKARFWDRAAHKYAAAPIDDIQGYENTLTRVQRLLSPQDAVLELGCGTGSSALRLAAATARYVATDVSPNMIAIAQEKWAAQPLPQLRFEVADAEALALDSGPYDAVLAFNVLHLMMSLDDALETALASLKPGGLLISKTPCLAEMNPLIPHLLVPLMRSIGRAPHVLSFDAGTLQSALKRHGLEIEAVERHGTRRTDPRVFIVGRKAR